MLKCIANLPSHSRYLRCTYKRWSFGQPVPQKPFRNMEYCHSCRRETPSFCFRTDRKFFRRPIQEDWNNRTQSSVITRMNFVGFPIFRKNQSEVPTRLRQLLSSQVLIRKENYTHEFYSAGHRVRMISLRTVYIHNYNGQDGANKMNVTRLPDLFVISGG